MLFLINRMRLSQIYSLFKPHAFASSAASDAAQRLAIGCAPQFHGRRRGFLGEPQSSTATVACGMCISPPPGQHAGSWGCRGSGGAVAALSLRAWVVCTVRMAVMVGLGAQFDGF